MLKNWQQSWHCNLLCQIWKFRVSDYSFRNLIRNSKPHPKPETSTETRNLKTSITYLWNLKTSITYLFILSKVGAEPLLCQFESFGLRIKTSESLSDLTLNLIRTETSPEHQKPPQLPYTLIALMYYISLSIIHQMHWCMLCISTIYIKRTDVCYISP